MIPQIIQEYQDVASQIKLKQKQEIDKLKNLKKYSIQEILDGNSSSDEDDNFDPMRQFPWFKKGYQNMYDDLEYDAKTRAKDDYPKDQKKVLEKKCEANFDEGPQRFLVITHN